MAEASSADDSQRVRGTTPEGTEDPGSAARAVREMFTAIAPRYDLLNHLLSANVDKLWWRRTARVFATTLSLHNARVLDLCCGTGDMAFALRRRGQAQITGVDFSHAMLRLALEKSNSSLPVSWFEADALRLPFADESFDLVTSAFGFRNLADYDAGLREIHRVLKPDGECGILEFSEPSGIIGKLYAVYFKWVLPKIGNLISGSNNAYSYLPASVQRFPSPKEMLVRLETTGFHNATWTPYTFGIAGLFKAKKR